MTSKPQLYWHEQPYSDGIGNAYGYQTHNDTLKKYAAEVFELTDKAEDAIWIVSPEFYDYRIPDKVNWIFTMFEGENMPPDYVEKIQKADYLIAPSTWVRRILSQYFDPDRIYVVPHGVEKDFKYKERKMPKSKFRFLWVGAPNPRKGYQQIIVIWQHTGLQDNPNFELYLKTTRVDKITGAGLVKRKNVYLDGRVLPRKELVKLYHNAHAFLFPTWGEGFGLTLAEAMRTGLPCVSTDYSGVTDFFDEWVGYPVSHHPAEGTIEKRDGIVRKTICAHPDIAEFTEAMINIVTDYKTAIARGLAASKRICRDFTWERSAAKLLEVITGASRN